MALIEVFHVVASELDIDATDATNIPQGRLVGLDANGQVVNADSTAGPLAIGIAGDTRSQGTTSFTPESGSSLSRNPATSLTGALVIGALGAQQRFTQNRIADNYNEVLASGKMTVYHSGGEFWTDQYELVQSGGTTVCTYVPGTTLGCSAAGDVAGGAELVSAPGRFTDEVADRAVQVVGYTLTAPSSYPSGVPGTEVGFTALPEGGNSLTWGTFLHVLLAIGQGT